MYNLKIIFFLIKRLFLIKFRGKLDLINILFVPVLIGFSTAFVLKYTAYNKIYSLTDNEKFAHFLFLSIIIIIFISLTNSVREIVANKVFIIKEKRSGLLPFHQFIAIFITLAFIALIQTTLYILASSFVVQLEESFWVFFVWLYLSAIAATSFGLFVSSIVNSEVTATMAIPLILIPQIILGGGLITFEQINKDLFIRNISVEAKNKAIPLISQFMISKWATEGLYVDLNTHFQMKREAINKKCHHFTVLEETLKSDFFAYLKSDVSQSLKDAKAKETQKLLKEVTIKRNNCNKPLNKYLNTKLNTLVMGGKSDFEGGFLNENFPAVLNQRMKKVNYVSADDLNETLVNTTKIINTFSSQIKFYGNTFFKTIFFNKIVIVVYSLFFLLLSYLFFRRI